MNPFKIFIATLLFKSKNSKIMEKTSIYDISIKSLKNEPINLAQFSGKYILFVNVASKCGFTPQYKDLQKLHDLYKDNIQVIGVPCNQFGGQEPGEASTIQEFCEVNYGVTFLMTEKVDVKGDKQHPLYKWLTQKELKNLGQNPFKFPCLNFS